MDYKKRSNAAYLLCAYLVICKQNTAEEAWKHLADISPPFTPFRDAINGECTYECTILDCLRGLEYAIKLKWYELALFRMIGGGRGARLGALDRSRRCKQR